MQQQEFSISTINGTDVHFLSLFFFKYSPNWKPLINWEFMFIPHEKSTQ